jgi:hypothetical protein
MPEHLKDGLVEHFSLLAMSHKRQQEEIQAYQKEIKTHQEEMKAMERRQEGEMKAIRGEVDELKKQTEHLRLNNMRIFPIDFRVKNPDRCTVDTPGSSTPFYSHSQGYKLRIDFFNKPWFGYFIRCYVMRGDFDHLLKWPLKAEMKLALLNQQRGSDYELHMKLDSSYSKPLGNEADAVKCGSQSLNLVSVFNLDPYLRNGYLHIRIVSVQF